MTTRHFLSLLDLSADELRGLLQRAMELKRLRNAGQPHASLSGKTLAMIFEKASTRTRVSFEAGMSQLGGHALFLSPDDTQLGRGESTEDTARVLSRMVDVIMIRNHSQRVLEVFAEHSQVPVINGLTDQLHPCQLLADMQTYFELRGDIAGHTVAWIGDGNNVCNSFILASRQFGFDLRISTPPGYEPPADLLRDNPQARLVNSPDEAAANAQLLVTDVWASMGDEDSEIRMQDFKAYQVNDSLMARAAPDALFMHCLPAHRGEEVTASVMDGPQSVVWAEAENRMHAQKALLEFLVARTHRS